MARKPDVDAAVLAALVRRAFGTSVPVRCERTPEGVSTQVYRLVRGPETFYLRVAEEPDENLETDAELHQRLLALGVRVPRVVFVEPFDATIGRSVAITTEVPGASLAAAACRPAVARAVAEAAGEDLGMINRLTVDGFGWVRRRGPGWPLRAEHASYLAFLTSYLPASWPGPLGSSCPAVSWRRWRRCWTPSALGRSRPDGWRTVISTRRRSIAREAATRA
jgi:aminoglycoside phosphotransferase (APT) family kinase protein